MSSPRRFSLKTKLAFFAAILVICVASSLSYYIRVGQKLAIVEGQDVSRIDTVKGLRQVARESILVYDDTGMVNFVNLLQKSLTTAYAMVLHEDGRVRVHTDPTQIGQRYSDDVVEKALRNRNRSEPLTQIVTAPDGRTIIDVSLPILIGSNPPEYKGIARIGFDKDLIDKETETSLRLVDSRIRRAFLMALILGLVGAFLLASFITRPIATLRKGAEEIGAGRLNHRITVHTNDELKDLADEFNLMAKKLGELDQMKQDFVSNVTHELRSPMTSIRGYIDLLLQEAGGPLSEIQRDYLSVIKNSSVRLGRFIDNLLDVAKIEANKLKLTPEALDLTTLAREMQVLFKPQMDEKRIVMENGVPATLSKAFVDKDKIAEVMINLASNAIKFSPEGGRLQWTATEGAEHIEMGLHDNGIGIPPDMINKLFSKFEQVKTNEGHARKHKGTGLGLAITKGIIEAHGGKIWIKSPGLFGKGTSFYFTLPKMTDAIRKKLAH